MYSAHQSISNTEIKRSTPTTGKEIDGNYHSAGHLVTVLFADAEIAEDDVE
jgi:hypothetical protein